MTHGDLVKILKNKKSTHNARRSAIRQYLTDVKSKKGK